MNTLKVGILLIALTVLFVGIGSWLGGPSGAVIALLLALAMNVGSFWFSGRMILKMTGAQPLTPAEAPELYRMTERLAERAGIPMPRLYRVPDAQPNAFATGRSPAHGVVAVNDGLLRLLSPAEVEGVIAHEIGHIKHRDTLTMTVAASIAGAVMMLVNIAQWAMIFGGGSEDEEEGAGGLASLFVMILVAPLAATVIQLAISRAGEFEADRTAAELSGTSDGLIGALLKLDQTAALVPATAQRPATAHLCIVNPLRGMGRGLTSLFTTHPPIEKRVERLRQLSDVRNVESSGRLAVA